MCDSRTTPIVKYTGIIVSIYDKYVSRYSVDSDEGESPATSIRAPVLPVPQCRVIWSMKLFIDNSSRDRGMNISLQASDVRNNSKIDIDVESI